eukprot:4543270-Pyramimonas_sp.AAC.1
MASALLPPPQAGACRIPGAEGGGGHHGGDFGGGAWPDPDGFLWVKTSIWKRSWGKPWKAKGFSVRASLIFARLSKIRWPPV